jgi:Kef-type K+ transport system membrane component KefB
MHNISGVYRLYILVFCVITLHSCHSVVYSQDVKTKHTVSLARDDPPYSSTATSLGKLNTPDPSLSEMTTTAVPKMASISQHSQSHSESLDSDIDSQPRTISYKSSESLKNIKNNGSKRKESQRVSRAAPTTSVVQNMRNSNATTSRSASSLRMEATADSDNSAIATGSKTEYHTRTMSVERELPGPGGSAAAPESDTELNVRSRFRSATDIPDDDGSVALEDDHIYDDSDSKHGDSDNGDGDDGGGKIEGEEEEEEEGQEEEEEEEEEKEDSQSRDAMPNSSESEPDSFEQHLRRTHKRDESSPSTSTPFAVPSPPKVVRTLINTTKATTTGTEQSSSTTKKKMTKPKTKIKSSKNKQTKPSKVTHSSHAVDNDRTSEDSSSTTARPESSSTTTTLISAVVPPPPPPKPSADAASEDDIINEVKQRIKQFEQEEMKEHAEIDHLRHQVTMLDDVIGAEVEKLKNALLSEGPDIRSPYGNGFHTGTKGANGERSDEIRKAQREQFIRFVKASVKTLTSTLNTTIERALGAMSERDKVIHDLLQREELVSAIHKNKQNKKTLKIDYESGYIKTSNGSLLRPLDSILTTDNSPSRSGSSGESLAPALDSDEPTYDPAVLQEDFVFLKDFVVLLSAATVGGLLAVHTRMPVFVGFIAGGMLVGPSGLAVVEKLKYVETLSQVGGPLLLFSQGLALQSTAIAPLNRRMLIAIGVQLFLNCIVLGVFMAFVGFANSISEALLLALCTGVSSSAVSMKIAEDNGHMRTSYYKVLLSLAVLQDFIMAFLLCLPAALHQGYLGIFVVMKQAFIVAILGSIAIIVAVKVVPRVIKFFVHRHNPELFLLSLVSLCLGTASFTRFLGLSTEFGAFFAGIILTRTKLVREAMLRIDPIKEVFCAMFFASIGLVISVPFIWKNVRLLTSIFFGVFIFKVVTTYLLLKWNGYSRTSSTLTSLCLAEIGEFSIFVAGNGFTMGIITRKSYLIFLAVTVFSLALTPLLFKAFISITKIEPAHKKTVIAVRDLEMSGIK